ncbi:MAG TPA: hypothetical protein VFM63_13325 [Pyrinomonadaceae bacterium]|nr:hypothetical protein [Pyrinomonadaceae bacterium]
MISSTLRVAGCLLVVCLIANAQNPAQKTRTSTISGKVTMKGNGVAGILVGVRLPQSGRREAAVVTETDDQGKYRLSNVAPGQYEVLLGAPQYVLSGVDRTKKLIVGEAENIENVDFSIVRGGAITGKVTDADGRPVIEEPVEVFGPEGPTAGPMSRMSGMSHTTDDRGVYRIFGLAPGKYRVAAGTPEDRMYYGRAPNAVYKQTFHPSTTDTAQATLIEVTEGSEATNVDITLGRTMGVFTVIARVVDAETGQPISGVNYGLEKMRENGSSSTSGFASDIRGEIKLESMTPGKYALFLLPTPARDVSSEAVPFEVVDRDIKDLVIKASSGGSIAGMIVFEGADEKTARTNLNGLMIYAHVMSAENKHRGGSSPQGTIGPDGSFKVGSLRAGTVFFSLFRHPTGQFEVSRVERDGVVIQPNLEIKAREQIKGLRLIVKLRSGKIRGVVKMENGQIPTSRIQVTAKRVGEENYETPMQVDDRGRFQSEALAAGVYEVRLLAYVGRVRPVQMTQQVVVSDNQVSEVTLTLDLKETVPNRP